MVLGHQSRHQQISKVLDKIARKAIDVTALIDHFSHELDAAASITV